MSIIEAILLGIVQGVTEFIPVSSSGHLILAQELFGVDGGSLAFDVALHGGTLLALLLFFRADILRLGRAFFIESKDTRLARLLAFATLPAVVLGVLFGDFIENSLRSTVIVAINLIAVAFLMLVAENQISNNKHPTKLTKTSSKQAAAIGFAQALAIIPGISRSGATITAGLFTGLDRVSATRFSFLLGIPIITGALLATLVGNGGMSEIQSQPIIFIVGVISAFISGWFAIRFLLRFLSKHTLKIFAYYRIVVGLIVLILAVL